MVWTPWLAALAPLTLIIAAMWPRPLQAPRRFADGAFMIALLGVVVSLAGAVVAGAGKQMTQTLGAPGLGLSIYLDGVSATMFVLVSFIGAVVLHYSRNYLDGDPNHGQFLRQLCFTIAAVQLLVIAGNYVALGFAVFFAGVGLNRLLLFYGERRGAVLAARKKFVASRLADLSFFGAGLYLYAIFGSLDYSVLLAASGPPPGHDAALAAATVLIALGALLKSAQLPLHGWLLEVMETPTPVSALLHAGIINAGGFIVIRFAGLMALSPTALHILAIVGGLTALFGSLVMLTQASVKVSLAYSTVAQMGFMLLQCGLGAFAAALLHIVAHSLYKAHAFLSSGSVIDRRRGVEYSGAGAKLHPARLFIALAIVLVLALGLCAIIGSTPASKPGVFALGAILMMGLTMLVAQAIDERPDPIVVGAAVLSATGVGALYFMLQTGVERLLANAVPDTVPTSDFVGIAVVFLAVGSFAGVLMLQNQMEGLVTSRWARALHVHLSQGFYLNTIANRLALELWPARGQTARRLSGE